MKKVIAVIFCRCISVSIDLFVFYQLGIASIDWFSQDRGGLDLDCLLHGISPYDFSFPSFCFFKKKLFV